MALLDIRLSSLDYHYGLLLLGQQSCHSVYLSIRISYLNFTELCTSKGIEFALKARYAIGLVVFFTVPVAASLYINKYRGAQLQSEIRHSTSKIRGEKGPASPTKKRPHTIAQSVYE
jgi:hypothetical protein